MREGERAADREGDGRPAAAAAEGTSHRPLFTVHRRIALAIAILVFLFDLPALPRHLLSYRDSLELVTASYLVQAAHPPGYPLFIYLGKLLTLPLGWIATVYTRYAVVNSLYGTAAVVLVYAIGVLLTGEMALSALAGLGLAWSYSFWLYRILPEVFIMANLTALTSFWLLLRWRQARLAGSATARRWWPAFALSLGLGLVVHQTTVLWWPACAWLIVATVALDELPGLFLLGIVPFLLGLLPNLLVWYMGTRPHLPMWGNSGEFQNFLDYLLRKDYGGLGNAGPVAEKADQAWTWAPLTTYLSHAWFNFGPFLLLVPAGAWLWWKPGRRWLGFLPLSVLLAGPIFITYARYRSESPFYLGSGETFYLPSFVLFTLLGIVMAHELFVAWPRLRVPALVALALVVVGELGINYPLVERRNSTLSMGFSRSLLAGLPPRAVLVVSDDRDIFTAFYEIWVARNKPDIVILNAGFMHKPAYRTELAAAYPDLQLNNSVTPSVFMRRFLRDNLGRGRPIYLATLRNDRLWGCLGNPYFLRPRGKVFEVLKDNHIIPQDRPVLPFSNELTFTYPPRDYWDLDLIVGYRLAWRNTGEVYTQLGLLKTARSVYRQLMQLDPADPEWGQMLGVLGTRPDTFRPRTDQDYHTTDPAVHDQAAMAFIGAVDYESAIQELEIASRLAPNNAKYADKLAVVLASMHDYVTALPAVQQALKLDPVNQKYLDDLELVQRHLKAGD